MSDDKWDIRFLALCDHIAEWSKDLSRKVGCVLVGANREVLSIGYNGFPRGVQDNVVGRYRKPEKYIWTEHAERNAVYNAARIGVNTSGCTAVCSLFPCADCARALIQCGVAVVVTREPEDWEHPHHHFRKSSQMLCEAGVVVKIVKE